MSDPRNVAHDKKVTQEKKHHGGEAAQHDAPSAQPGKKAAAEKGKGDVDSAVAPGELTTEASAATASASSTTPSHALEGSLVVLGKLKELEFHSRANLERLAELGMTVEDELKQKAFVAPMADVYAAQSTFQTTITSLIDAYKSECDRMQGPG